MAEIVTESAMTTLGHEKQHSADINTSSSDRRPESAHDRPMPTDSMVTVRLSSETANSDKSHPSSFTRTSAAEPVRKSIRFSFIGGLDGAGISTESDEVAIDDSPGMVSSTEENRASLTSISTAHEDDTLASVASTIRSRSDSSGTLSSNGSAQVDWDELDKSEEQAPRDEGSDEVGSMEPTSLSC